ncbi:alpha/beta hydrolase family protein [Streptomyces sp. NPDC056480]|uniref:alpha/beta hydrolase family protein n=1 Tax=Streptomyces sp. NPDC056480 TaxID=3345833 RepID=UPI0036A8FA2B
MLREPLRRLRSLDSLEGIVKPLAFDAGGTSLFLSTEQGVRSVLIRHHLEHDTSEKVDIPLGIITGYGSYQQGQLHLPFSAPDQPATLAAFTTRPRNHSRTTTRDTPANAVARTELFPTPAGPVEALVYGYPWNTAERVIVALHGGPESHWRADCNPTLALLSTAGTVIAINQRGSTGYGQSHQEAIHHAWGGPDLADIHAIADHISRHRDHPNTEIMIFGTSYGAYLALLAAATQPNQWSHCAAIAPFLSGELLYNDASADVRRLIDRLGGRTEIRDSHGPRDLLRLADKLRTRTLLIHGAADPIIPVSHSRRLHQRLASLGRCAQLEYIEALGGHNPPYDRGGRPIGDHLVEFFSRSHTSSPSS